MFFVKKRLLLLLLLLSVTLSGCGGRSPKQFSPNPDGTVGRFRWGMTIAEACQADERIAAEHNDPPWPDEHTAEAESYHCNIDEVEFLGKTTSLVLFFCRIPSEGAEAPLRLTQIRAVLFLEEGDPDYTSLVAKQVSSRLKETAEGLWESPETLGDRVPRSALAEFYPDWGEETLDRFCANPLCSVQVQSLNGPIDVYGTESSTTGYREFYYTAAGYYQVLGEILKK